MSIVHLQPRKASKPILLVFSLLSICCLSLSAPAEAATFTVAVVRDGPSAEDEFLPRIEAELGQFVSVDRTIRFKPDAAWDPARVVPTKNLVCRVNSLT